MTTSGSQEQEEYEEFISRSLDLRIVPHIRVNGLKRINTKVIEKDLEAVKHWSTLRDVTLALEEASEKWRSLGFFKDVKYFFQPMEESSPNDVCVNVEVTELPAQKQLSIMTTESAYPEINASLENIFGGRYSVKGSYISPASRMHAVSLSAVSNAPFLGNSGEYSLGHYTEKKNFHFASAERVFEVKAVGRNQKGCVGSEFTVGFQRRHLIPVNKEDILKEDMVDFGTTYKGYVRHNLTLSKVNYHNHPVLFQMYPLPISGTVIQLRNEVAGFKMGGDFNFFKSEVQGTKLWCLGPFFTLNWSTRLGAIVTDWRQPNTRVPLNDRLFLAGSHVRGFKAIGPSTLDRLNTASRFAAEGGNALWASSLSLSFPFIGFPQNGFAAMHVFANAGNLRQVRSFSQLTDYWKWFRECACSVGAGIVVTRIPLLGVLPSGRFEVNFAVPLGMTKNGDVTTRNGPSELFERVRFGLVWSSDTIQ